MHTKRVGIRKLFARANDFNPRFATTRHTKHRPIQNIPLTHLISGKTLIVPANMDEVKIMEIITQRTRKNFDEEIFSNAFAPLLRKKYISPKKIIPVTKMRKYETSPKREKYTAISLPVANPEPIIVPIIIIIAEKVFFIKTNIFLFLAKDTYK